MVGCFAVGIALASLAGCSHAPFQPRAMARSWRCPSPGTEPVGWWRWYLWRLLLWGESRYVRKLIRRREKKKWKR